MRDVSTGAQVINQLHLQARIESLGSERYTPAGILALDLVLNHQSTQMEAANARQVQLSIKAVAFAEMAKAIRQADMQTEYRFFGFLASRGRTQQVILHIAGFEAV